MHVHDAPSKQHIYDKKNPSNRKNNIISDVIVKIIGLIVAQQLFASSRPGPGQTEVAGPGCAFV